MDAFFDLNAAIAASADPQTAAESLSRLRDSAERQHIRLPDPAELELLTPLLACQSPGARIASSPRVARFLTQTPYLQEEKPLNVYRSELRPRVASVADGTAVDRVLRLYRHREMARIALRDLSRRASLRIVVREVSHLADALVDAAVWFWDHQLAAKYGEPLGDRFCVIAMGKHGAKELNYSSDIDVLFVFDADEKTPSGAERRDHAIALSQSIIRSLSRITGNGFAFRVDANLRPYGRDGPLAQSMEEMERYYERAGQTWERAALIKARPCAGGLSLGQELIDRLQPFIFRRTLDMDAVEALAAMKRKIDRDQAHSPRDNVKLGHGGIREIEFFVQALQLLHGGRQRRLRTRATLAALDELLYTGLISSRDHAALAEAYVFLRDTEHRLQLPQDRQTQVLPDPSEHRARVVLARRMGFTDVGPFDQALAHHRRNVHERFVGLLAVAAEEQAPRRETEVALSAQATDEARLAALVTLGFQEPETALAEVRRLQRLPESALGARSRERHPGLSDRLLEEMTRSPDPDLALLQFTGLFSSLWQPAAATELLASNPATARLLILLFGSSETLTRDLQLHPELLDLLVRSDAAVERPSRDSFAATIRDRLAKAQDPDERMSALRVLRRDETLRIALMDLAGRLQSAEVGASLTELAELILIEVYATARAEVAERYGEPANAKFAVLGLGSFGGHELDYESDLDLVFMYDAEGPTSGGTRAPVESNEWAARLSQKILAHLTLHGPEGLLYRVDARLRPSGTQGPLVASLESFAGYHGAIEVEGGTARGAALWERQALLRARPVTGDESLLQTVVTKVLDVVARQPAPAETGAQIAEMRYRLDANGPGGAIYTKKGPGGLLDVEFLTQFLQMKHGVRAPSTRRALDLIAEHRWISPALHRDVARNYEFLRRVESRLRLRYWRPDVFVPPVGAGLARLARQLGDAGTDGGPRLWRDLTRIMARNREIFAQVVRS